MSYLAFSASFGYLCYESTAIIIYFALIARTSTLDVGIWFCHLKSVPAQKELICFISRLNRSYWEWNVCLNIKIGNAWSKKNAVMFNLCLVFQFAQSVTSRGLWVLGVNSAGTSAGVMTGGEVDGHPLVSSGQS